MDDRIVSLTQRLLACYQEALDLAQHPPLVRLIPFTGAGVGSLVKLPRLRLFLGYFVVLHISRALADLKRRLHREAVLADDETRYEREIKLLDRFEQSLPPLPTRSLLVFLLVAVLLVSYVAARSLGGSNSDLRPFGSLISGVLQVNRGHVVDAVGRYNWYTAYFTALGVSISFWVLLLLPMTSFQLKRIIFNLAPGAGTKLDRTTLGDNRPPLRGVYQVERELFAELGATAPRELRLDLVLEAILVVLTIGLVAYTAADVLHSPGQLATFRNHLFHPREAKALQFLGTLALVLLLLLRLAWLTQASRSRREPTRAVVRPRAPRIAASLKPAGWRRRAIAVILDETAVFVIWVLLIFPLVAVGKTIGSGLELGLAYAVAFPLAPVLYVAPWLIWGSRERGFRTPGKRLLGLEVLSQDDKRPSARAVLVREALGKWILFGFLTSFLVVPWLLDYLWPLRDARHRALHDRLAGTVVVRCEEPALATAPAGGAALTTP